MNIEEHNLKQYDRLQNIKKEIMKLPPSRDDFFTKEQVDDFFTEYFGEKPTLLDKIAKKELTDNQKQVKLLITRAVIEYKLDNWQKAGELLELTKEFLGFVKG